MPFTYRLQKILDFRIQKKDEQIEVVKKEEREVLRIQNEIDKNKNTVLLLRKSMHSAPHTMIESYDIYINHLHEIIAKLEEEKEQAVKKLEEEREKLVELEKGVKVLEKHREKAQEQYLEEEKQQEMRELDEIAGQRYFRQSEERKIQEILEQDISLDEY